MGFFEIVEGVWTEADRERTQAISNHGQSLGDWYADIRQYGAAWQGDAWESEAVRAENHLAFSQIGDLAFWDHVPRGTGIMHFHVSVDFETGETVNNSTVRRAVASLAGGDIVV